MAKLTVTLTASVEVSDQDVEQVVEKLMRREIVPQLYFTNLDGMVCDPGGTSPDVEDIWEHGVDGTEQNLVCSK